MRNFGAEIVQKVKTHILCSIPSPPPLKNHPAFMK